MSRKEKRGAVTEIVQSGYYARIMKQRGRYLVEFPDLPGCLTEGKTIREALDHGREALSGWLFVAIKKGDVVLPSRVRRGREYHLIAPDVDVAIPLAILFARKRRGFTQEQVADALGISQQAYRKFEMPGKSNPTLRSLQRLSEVLGLELSLRAA
jgi:antitoxin HicB